ncbi:MAG: hypothetical protein M1828_004788 [Chrysothrix sp. TS-e1954]|nr:MAG: hypothetical protein M1828_004788 [Chrysothrix sp. TS-e1954]
MCRTKYWMDRECGHQWLTLEKKCGKGMNLVTCPMFRAGYHSDPGDIPGKGTAINGPRRIAINHYETDEEPGWAPIGNCPRCDFDEYDMGIMRLVMEPVKIGTRAGRSANKKDVGVDFPGCFCAVM